MGNSFPRIITLLRKEKKLSQKDAAKDLGISQALLSHYEKGIRECGLEFLVRIAAYYGVSCDYLLGLTTVKNASLPEANISKQKKPKQTELDKNILSLTNSVKILLLISSRFSCPDLTKEIFKYFKTCIYRIFRILYSANSKNPQSFFSKDDKSYLAASACEAITAENKITCLSCGKNISDCVAGPKESIPSITPDIISNDYPECSQSLMQLITEVEAL